MAFNETYNILDLNKVTIWFNTNAAYQCPTLVPQMPKEI